MNGSAIDPERPEAGDEPRSVPYGEAFRTWCRVAALSFGGPAGQIAVMHRILVEENRWIDEERFLHALNYCMLLPGPEAQQLATYIGWLLHRTRGALTAGILFILPGALAILALSVAYVTWQETSWLQGVLFGLKPAVLALVGEAMLRIGRRVLKSGAMLFMAVGAFAAIWLAGVPFPVLIATAAAIGWIGGRLRPDQFVVLKGRSEPARGGAQEPARPIELYAPAPSWRRSLLVSAVCLPLWFGPLVLLRVLLGPDSTLYQEGVFFSKAAVVTFGGAYSVLAYIGQQAVERYAWLEPGQMLDGLGMAETTPGPLIMVVQFVGFLGAYHHPGPFSPLVAGLLGSAVATWVTFAPCFYWILLGAPYIERLRANRNLTAALSAITAAVVGVIANLTLWFALHVLFGEVRRIDGGPLHLEYPALTTVDAAACVIALAAVGLLHFAKRSLPVVLVVCCLLGLLLRGL